MEDDNVNRIIDELRRQTKIGVLSNVFAIVALVIILAVSIGYREYREKALERKRDVPVWTRINDAVGKNDRKEEFRLVKELLDKAPNDYYLHSYIGGLYVQSRDLELAKKHFEISYKLFPIKDTEEKLAAVKKALIEK